MDDRPIFSLLESVSSCLLYCINTTNGFQIFSYFSSRKGGPSHISHHLLYHAPPKIFFDYGMMAVVSHFSTEKIVKQALLPVCSIEHGSIQCHGDYLHTSID